MSAAAGSVNEEGRDEPQPIMAHLNELRWRLVRAAAAVFIGALIGLLFKDWATSVLERPYLDACSNACTFQTIDPTEQFAVWMKVALFGGVLLGSPVILWQIWGFINPALTSKERKWAVPIIMSCVTLFILGVGFGYWTLPRALNFLTSIFDVQVALTLSNYFSFALRYLLAFGASFLYPVFLFAAAAVGLVSSSQLAHGRRWAVLVIVVVAAAITPTGDALTLTLLSVPLYLFYEITYWLVRLVLRK